MNWSQTTWWIARTLGVCVSIALSSNLISLSRWVVMTRTNDIPRHATANEKCTRGHIRWPQMLSSFHLEIKFGIHQIDAHQIYLRCCRFERWTERTNSVAQYNKSTTFVLFSTRVWLEDGGPGQAITNNTGIPNEMIKHHLSCNVRRQPAAGRRWLPSKWALVLECPSSRPRIARWKSKNQITAFDLLISRKRIAHHSFDPASEQTPASQPANSGGHQARTEEASEFIMHLCDSKTLPTSQISLWKVKCKFEKMHRVRPLKTGSSRSERLRSGFP